MSSYDVIKKGAVIKHKGVPHVVVHHQHYKPGKGAAFVKAKLKNLINNSVQDETFKGGSAIELVEVERQNLQYLYPGDTEYHFMRTDSYEQISLSKDVVGDQMVWLKEGQEVIGLFFEGSVVSIDIPKKVTLEVKTAGEGVRGDTASGTATKEVELETGTTIQVPLFIKQGSRIVVNTDTGQYVERA